MSRLIVYRLLPAGATGPTLGWHALAKCHLDSACAFRFMRRRSSMVRQVFDFGDVPDWMWCNLCSDRRSRRRKHEDWMRRWHVNGENEGRARYVDAARKRWQGAFTDIHADALAPCDRRAVPA